ncbi:Uma2 family endonuclease [Spirosoma montaniterrae]|uniref:Putative restriction endonuclease domain-containing protein n=1 Tax=Spirosoma montaniterrae TaxID=1178516 RepID=A0A1P9X014_9BACT|nr:Uma2 family endonuclease [Spirosoma montaniterrae]AQG80943.1 hypothetical protein AWR27_17405 [Spirosoma montaniterrae]
MEATVVNVPAITHDLAEDELLRMPATWDDYFQVLDEADSTVTVQFLDGEIIMSQASRAHESLVIVLGTLLSMHFIGKPAYDVLGSNVKIVIPNRAGDVNADVSVVKEPVLYGETPNGNVSDMRIKNPEIVVEVLSKSTRKFDLEEKLSYYKLIPSLQYILFVDQYRPFASVYARTPVPDEWLNHDYRTLDAVVRMGDVELPMTHIYRKITVTK